MKLFFSLSFLTATAVAGNSSSLRPQERRQLLETNEICLLGWELRNDEGCNYQNLLKTLNEKLSRTSRCAGRTAEDELRLIFGLETADTLEQIINDMCREAYHDRYEQDGLSFLDITGEDEVFNKEYFDGGTFYNEERQTSTTKLGFTNDILSQNPGARIRSVHGKYARSRLFEWPDDLSNFDECALNAAMCCWVQDRQAGDDNGNCDTPYDDNCVDADPMDNTDLCYVDMSRARESSRVQRGYAVFPGDDNEGEGAVHCHGFAWAENDLDPSGLFKSNNLFFVSMYDHLQQRGYVRNVPGAPMCGCLEQMPVVSRSDCTQIDVTRLRAKFDYLNGALKITIPQISIAFNPCKGANGNNNDLDAYYERLTNEQKATKSDLEKVRKIVVGDGKCADAISQFATATISRA